MGQITSEEELDRTTSGSTTTTSASQTLSTNSLSPTRGELISNLSQIITNPHTGSLLSFEGLTLSPRDAIADLIYHFSSDAHSQLYSLSIAEYLANTDLSQIHEELASPKFTQAITNLINNITTFANVKFRAVQLMIQWTSKCITYPALSSFKEILTLLEKQQPHLVAASRASKRSAQETDWKKCEEELQIALALTLRAEQNKLRPPKEMKVRRRPRITAVCKLSSRGVEFYIHKVTLLGAVYMDLQKKGDKEDGKCRVCCYRLGDCCVIPCGHTGLCSVCAKRCRQCPFCSKGVEHIQKLCQV